MNNIEDIIRQVSKNDIKIPTRIENRINYALKNKSINKNKHFLRNFITAIISILCTLVGGLSVYATFGGTINGKPVIQWLGFNFSSNYDEYKEDVVNQQVSYNETTIDLISTVCDEGFTILEFDVKLSEADKEYLRLDKNVVTEEDIEKIRQEYEDRSRTNEKSQGIPFEESAEYKFFNESKDIKNTIRLEFQNQVGTGKINNIFINDEGYYVKTIQTANKIADNEYRVYQLYLLTDEILKGKEEFEIKLKNIVLKNIADNTKNKTKKTTFLANTPYNARSIDINGEVTANLSKKKIADNIKIIENENKEIKYKKMTEKIEKISQTPIQTVIKISKSYNNISLQDISSTMDEDYIGVERYTVKDNNGNEIPSINFETKRTITYSNGKKEEWSPGDIGTYKNFSNANLETIEYLIIEQRNDVSNLKIISDVEEIVMNEGSTFNWKNIGEYNITFNEDE